MSDDPVPKQLQEYMATWKKFLPDYEFVKWDFTRFDKSSSDWVSEAFDNKKYAFAADYIRMYALYTMGGIYMDMDVEVLKPFDDLLGQNYFLCYECDSEIPEVATFGVEKGCEWVSLMLEYYRDRHFVLPDGKLDTVPLPLVTKRVLESHGYGLRPVSSLSSYKETVSNSSVDNKAVYVLPHDFFSPKSYSTGKLKVTKNTYSIHRFSCSWMPWWLKAERKFWRMLGCKPYSLVQFLQKKFKNGAKKQRPS